MFRQTFFVLHRRARHHWQMLLTLSLGVILATALMASGPILIDNVLTLALQQTLRGSDALEANLLLTDRQPPETAVYQNIDQQLRQLLPDHLPSTYTTIVPSAGLRPVFPWVDDRLETDERLVIQFYGEREADFQSQVRFVAGDWPAPFDPTSGETVPVVIGQPLAQAYQLEVGDRLPASQRNDATEATLLFEVAGIVQATDNQAAFWGRDRNPLRAREENGFRQYSVFVSQPSLFAIAQTVFPDLDINFAWLLLINGRSLDMAEAAVLPQRIANLEAVLQDSEVQLNVQTALPDTIDAFMTQADAVRSPLYFLVTTVVLLALYYVTMIASLGLVRLQQEFVLMRSRGASAGQLLNFQFVEGVIISSVAFISGPLIARFLIQGLAAFGPLGQLNQADWALTVPQVAWLAAIVGAAACLGSLLWPVPAAVRQTAVHYQQTQTRVAQTSWWQRFYLDVVLLLVGLILLWRFTALGGLINEAGGAGQVDWIILVAPLALLFGMATLLLRLFPLGLNGLARLVGRGSGVTAALALWQTARDPRHVTRLVLLLTLTMAIGIFATSLSAALDLNEEARARYAVGSDARLLNVQQTETAVSDPLLAASAIWRGTASFESAINGRYPLAEILAVDPTTLNDVTNYRADFASQPVPDLLSSMEGAFSDNQIARGVDMPEGSVAFGLWLRLPFDVETAWEGVDLDVKFVDGNDQLHTVPLRYDGRSEETWRYFEGDLSDLPQPLRLRSIWLRSRTFDPDFRQNLAFDAFTAVLANGETVLFEDFEQETAVWGPIDFTQIFTLHSTVTPLSGNNRLDIAFGQRGASSTIWYGIHHFDNTIPFSLPALVSAEFLDQTALEIGDPVGMRVQLSAAEAVPFTFQIVGVLDYFPTLYDSAEEAGYLVTLRDPLLNEINGSRHDPLLPNELLLDQAGMPSQPLAETAPELFGQASRVLEQEAVQETLRAFPMALGLRSAALFGYILATVLSLAGFSSNFILSTRQRVGQYGILRALGLAPQQLYRMLMLEQLLLIASGLLLGTGLGVLLTRLTLTNLNFSWGALAAAPPFLPTFDWLAVGRVYLLLGCVFVVALLLGTAVLRRLDIYRTLRIGEE